MFPLALLPLPLFLHLVGALTNVTIDDTKTSMISYLGKWEASSTHVSEQDYGGSHTLSSDREASAIFKFTGVAVYYLAARWPYRISTQLRLDDGDPVLVDLTDHKAPSAPEGGPSSASFSVAWKAEGLTNTSHTLVATTGAGTFIIVDGFIITVDDGSTSSSSSASQSSSSSTSTATMAASSPPVSRRQTGTTIGLAVALGGMIFIAGAIIGFVLCRRRRNPKQYPPHKHIPPQDGRSLRSYFVPTSRTTQRGNYSTLDDASAHDTDMSYMSSVPLRSVHPPPTTVTDPWERQGSVNVYRDVSESSGSHYTPRTAPTEISLPAGAKPAVPFLDGTALDDALSSSSSSISRTVSSHLAVATHPNHGRSAGLPAYSES